MADGGMFYRKNFQNPVLNGRSLKNICHMSLEGGYTNLVELGGILRLVPRNCRKWSYEAHNWYGARSGVT